jgi:hypothetical protein
MSREAHVQFCEGLLGKFQRSTLLAFKEDQLQARAGFAGENLAVIRQWILNVLKQNKTRSLSMANKRRLCCLNEDYLFESMGLFNK